MNEVERLESAVSPERDLDKNAVANKILKRWLESAVSPERDLDLCDSRRK